MISIAFYPLNTSARCERKNRSQARLGSVAMIACLVAASLLPGASAADEHSRHRDGASDREVYRSRHWVLDDRHHHAHYYPSMGYSIASLPPGHLEIRFGNGRYFFHSGVWYQPFRRSFRVVRPPVGIMVPVLPSAVTTVVIGGVAYYYANEVYYQTVPGGYTVIAQPIDRPPSPPPGNTAPAMPPAITPLPPSEAPAPSSNQSATLPPAPIGGAWYWCEAARAYYPHVTECKEGWKAVPTTPPGVR